MNPSILIAGKSNRIHQLVKTAFANTEINIVRAPTMSLSLFLAQKNLPFFIISDIDLVDGEAESFLQGLKGDIELRHIPVVFFSTTQNDEKRAALLRSGAAKVCDEPSNVRELLDQIRPWIQTRAPGRVFSADESTE
jgi:DNA-binding response OmpR family regulator